MKNPKNLTRVLVQWKIGVWSFALYKDGMYKSDESKNWSHPEEVRKWWTIEELKNCLK